MVPFQMVAVSPGRSPTKGQLTGPARKVKDVCADWHNSVEKWQSMNSKGMAVITEMANLKVQAVESVGDEDGAGTAGGPQMPPALEPLCDTLLQLYNSLAKVVQKMEALTQALKGIADLEWYQENQSFCEEPLFQTWTTDVFYDTSKELLSMYQAELAVKETLVQNVAHAPSRDVLMFYTAAWLHQAYIPDRAKLLLESMLTETGHR